MINAAKRIREVEQKKKKNGRWNVQCKRKEIQLA